MTASTTPSTSSEPASKLKAPVIAGLGGGLVTLVLATLSELTPETAWLMAPFGASLVILFALPDSPLAQPRNLVGGHLLTAIVGLTVMSLIGVTPLSLGLAVGIAISLMMLTGTLHPPAGANPLLIMLSGKSWVFLINPILIGCLAIVVLGLIFHRVNNQNWPKRWF